MRKVRAKNTAPELILRRLLRSMGYRGYRIHYDKLPGKPDVVFTRRKKVIFVHGCFWHGHHCRAGRNTPKSNIGYWEPKLAGNKARDKRNIQRIRRAGWRVLVIWECQLRDVAKIKRRFQKFFA